MDKVKWLANLLLWLMTIYIIIYELEYHVPGVVVLHHLDPLLSILILRLAMGIKEM